MKTLHQAILKLIGSNSLLISGLNNGLFNLSKLSKFIKPLLEIELERTLSDESIHMQLSRIQRMACFDVVENNTIGVSGVHMQPNLCIYIFHKNSNLHEGLLKFSSHIRNNNGYFINTESLDKITIIFEDTYIDIMKDYISNIPIEIFTNISGISSRFQRNHKHESGFLYALTQQMYFANISIVEVISSDIEIIFYVGDVDAKRGFEVIYDAFSK